MRDFVRPSNFFRRFLPVKSTERIPFASDGISKSSGAILRTLPTSKGSENINAASENNAMMKKKSENDCSHESKERLIQTTEEGEPMSYSRKACFLLSFNVWILYVATFLWFIPCKFKECPSTLQWNVSFHDIALTTNLIAVGDLALFGFRNVSTAESAESVVGIGALNSSDGSITWMRVLDGPLFQLHCPETPISKSSVCYAVGEAGLTSFNSSNGYSLWEQSFGSDDVDFRGAGTVIPCIGKKTPAIISSAARIDGSAILHKLFLLDASPDADQMKFSFVPLLFGCEDLTLKIKSVNNDNETNWMFVCFHPKSADIWAISEKHLCAYEGKKNATDIDENFYFLYHINESFSSSHEILLTDVGDDGIVLSWANTLVLLSKTKPSKEIWRRKFEKILNRLVIPGYFTSKNTMEIAVATKDERLNNVVYVLALSDGSVLSFMVVENALLRSMTRIPTTQNTDLLLIEKVLGNTSNSSLDFVEKWKISNVMEKVHVSEESSELRVIGFEPAAIIHTVIKATSLAGKAVFSLTKTGSHLILAERRYDDWTTVFSSYFFNTSAMAVCRK